ncbi:hypothetical protein PWT90_00769 [Aphanocladium album]|nr:hypothetical protein PWT90_00769 [Aphanocladium album]
MKRVLLTSSQVSIILTGIVTLFLSGYVIQQRTVNDLREAIRPRARPVMKPKLPERFKARITELDDGSIVFYESEADEEARQQRQHIEIRESTQGEREAEAEETRINQEREMQKATQKQRQMLEDIQSKVAKQTWSVENPDPWAKSKVPIDAVERRQMIKDELKRLSMSDGPVPWSKRIWS